MADVFLSYRNLPDRRAIVGRLAYILDAHKISVWWDYGLDAGDSYREQITREMADAKIVVPLWCEESVASPWVLMEAELGKDKLFPARLQSVAPPTAFEAIHAAHLERWNGSINDPALMDYIRRICVRLGKPDDLPGFIREQLAGLPEIAPLPPAKRSGPATLVSAAPPAQALWSPIEQSLDVRDYEDFLTHHPQASQAAEARRRLRQLGDWQQVDQTSAAAIKAFQAGAREKSRLFPALEALVARKLRQVAGAARAKEAGTKGPGLSPAMIGAAAVLVLGGGAGTAWMVDPFGWRTGGVDATYTEYTGEAEPAEYASAEVAVEAPAEEAVPAEGAAEDPSEIEVAVVDQAALDRATAEQVERDRVAREAADKAAQEYRDREARLAAERTQQQQAAADKADDDAWQIARSSGTVAGIQAYLNRYPYGRNASAARTELTKLTAFNPDLLNAQVRSAALSAREAQRQALAASAKAATAAAKADEIVIKGRADGTSITVENFKDSIYEVQWANGKRSGYGIFWSTGGNYKGYDYRGQWDNNTQNGYGVSDFSKSDLKSSTLKFSGRHVNGAYDGPGVHTWYTGQRYEGNFVNNRPEGYGVYFYTTGWRYEGEMVNNQRSGYGVVWTSSGELSQSGRWSGDALVEALSK